MKRNTMMCLFYAPPKCVAEIGNRIMAMDGCMNIYASTADKNYRAGMNIYGSHYLKTKLIGSSGGLRSDLIEALDLITTGKINQQWNSHTLEESMRLSIPHYI